MPSPSCPGMEPRETHGDVGVVREHLPLVPKAVRHELRKTHRWMRRHAWASQEQVGGAQTNKEEQGTQVQFTLEPLPPSQGPRLPVPRTAPQDTTRGHPRDAGDHGKACRMPKGTRWKEIKEKKQSWEKKIYA